MPPIVFYLHGKSGATDGITIDVQPSDDPQAMDQLRKIVSEEFSVALPGTLSFHQAADADTPPNDLKALEAVADILAERTVAILISGKKVGLLFFRSFY
jgi:hypothetical protein